MGMGRVKRGGKHAGYTSKPAAIWRGLSWLVDRFGSGAIHISRNWSIMQFPLSGRKEWERVLSILKSYWLRLFSNELFLVGTFSKLFIISWNSKVIFEKQYCFIKNLNILHLKFGFQNFVNFVLRLTLYVMYSFCWQYLDCQNNILFLYTWEMIMGLADMSCHMI